MKSWVGMEETEPGSLLENCYQLLKGIHGLCQAAGQFLKTFVGITKKKLLASQ